MRIILCFFFPRFDICSTYKYEERTQIWSFTCFSFPSNNMPKFYLSRMEWFAPIKFTSTNRNHLWPHPSETWCEDWTHEVEVLERRRMEEQQQNKPPECWEEEVRERELSIPNNSFHVKELERERSMGTK